MPVLTNARWASLAGDLRGDLLLPGDEAFEWARKPFIARFDDVLPQAVLRCADPLDVINGLRFAREHGLEIAARSGGHCFAGYSSTSGLLLDVTPMDDVILDGELARVGAGTRVGALSHALAAHGRVVPSGSCPTVGVGGTTLGGGLGVLGRVYGLTCDQVVAVEVVLADGRVVTADAEREPDLYWALRGAGAGHFGVVTGFTFLTHPSPRMTNFYYVWPLRCAVEILLAWQDWAPDAPEELACGLALTATSDLAEEPFVEIYGAMVGTESDVLEQLGHLVDRVGEAPSERNQRELSYAETALYQAGLLTAANTVVETPVGQVERQGHRFTKSEFFDRPLPRAAVEELVRRFPENRAAGDYRGLELAPWGGAYCRPAPDATAFVHRDQRFSLKHAILVDPDAPASRKAAGHTWVTRSWECVHPYGTGAVYPNFPDPDLPDGPAAYYGANLDRLVRIKQRYDPENVFVRPQPLST